MNNTGKTPDETQSRHDGETREGGFYACRRAREVYLSVRHRTRLLMVQFFPQLHQWRSPFSKTPQTHHNNQCCELSLNCHQMLIIKKSLVQYNID